MNLSAILVLLRQDRFDEGVAMLDAQPGIEVHHGEPATGRVVLGEKDECTTAAMRVSELNWIGFDPREEDASGAFRCVVQFRYHCVPAPATVHVSGTEARVEFDEPQFAVAPGQGAAFYREDRLLGGGWIRP